jgi:hypothetical protein
MEVGRKLVAVGIVVIVSMVGINVAIHPPASTVGQTSNSTLLGSQSGSVTLIDPAGQQEWKIDDADSYFDVTKTGEETVLAAVYRGDRSRCGPYQSPCSRTGFEVVRLGEQPRTTVSYTYPVRTGRNSEVHDVERISPDRFVVADMEHERIVVVSTDGEIEWEWNASSFYEAPEDPTRVDWLHINDVDKIGPEKFLISVRNENQLLVIEKSEGVVEVVNRDGDPDLFHQQHNPQWLGENAVLVADSENDRVVEVHRNTSDGEWYVAWSLTGAGGIGFSWPRDADRLENGNTLITDTRNRRIVEVDKNGTVVWSTTVQGDLPYEADRLPRGETVGGTRYTEPMSERVSGQNMPTYIRGVTPAAGLLRHHVRLPTWFTEGELLTGAAGIGFVLLGGGMELSRRFDRG